MLTNTASAKFFTKSEEVTYEKLENVCDRVGAKVFPKVRLIDVLRCYPIPLDNSEESFSLKAHLDFVVVSSEKNPIFSVEFDGPSHNDPKQVERDNVKNKILQRFEHPLLRINSRYLDVKYRGLDLLTYLVDVWFLAESFYGAQESGIVHLDEPFDANFLQIYDPSYKSPWPWNLSYEIVNEMHDLFKKGKLIQRSSDNLIGCDNHENVRCLTWIFIEPDKAVLVKTGMKHQNFPLIDFTDVLDHIALNDLHNNLKLALSVNSATVTAKVIMDEMKMFKRKFQILSSRCSGFSKPPAFKESITIFSSKGR